MMFNGDIREVTNLSLGDLLMGVDSKPRTIKSINISKREIYRVFPKKGESFLISANERLFLSRSKNSCLHLKEAYELTCEEYLNKNISFKNRYCLSKAPVNFNLKSQLPIKPYVLGTWLGDGTSSNTDLTTMDHAIYSEYKEYVESLGLTLKVRCQKGKATTYAATTLKGSNTRVHPNIFLNKLRNLNLLNNKHIPQAYLIASESERLELLAGLIDTDGCLLSNNVIEISQKNKILASQIVFLARSLGFACTIKDSLKKAQTGPIRTYKRIQICGNTIRIPVRLDRKKPKSFKQEKNPLKIGIFSVQYETVSDIVSFSFEEDCQKYIDEHFFVRTA